ncbi:MAG: hypothetical protein Ct9H300mP16_11370 [Pseudomonadota bacterium]|nr:MAG: hypothetical protein Ct9H300mP16_11370 [Pseudomonadota bacterium]
MDKQVKSLPRAALSARIIDPMPDPFPLLFSSFPLGHKEVPKPHRLDQPRHQHGFRWTPLGTADRLPRIQSSGRLRNGHDVRQRRSIVAAPHHAQSCQSLGRQCGSPDSKLPQSPSSVTGSGHQPGHIDGATDQPACGYYRAGPSATSCELSPSIPHVLSLAEIEQIISDYGKACFRLKDCGFDGADLAFYDDQLPDQFWSPDTNRRNDRYGGSLENRLRSRWRFWKTYALWSGGISSSARGSRARTDRAVTCRMRTCWRSSVNSTDRLAGLFHGHRRYHLDLQIPGMEHTISVL